MTMKLGVKQVALEYEEGSARRSACVDDWDMDLRIVEDVDGSRWGNLVAS
jgi:hypothetical protein